MNKSDSLANLAVALSKFQGTIDDVSKDSRGQKGDYASLGALLSAVRPHLHEHGLSHSQLISNNSNEGVSIETMLLHKSGEYISSSMYMPIERILTRDGRDVTNQSQAIGSAITYARRYAIAAILGITQKDDDADSCEPNPKPDFKRQESKQPPIVKINHDQALELLDLIVTAGYTEDKVKAHYKVNTLLDMSIPMWEACKGVMNKKIAEKVEVANDNP